MTQLKGVFGNVSTNQANKLCSLVKEIASKLDDECLDYVRNLDNSAFTESKFGDSIKCDMMSEYFQDTLFLQDLAPSSNDGGKTLDNFSMKYENSKDFQSSQKIETAPESSNNKYNKVWLTKHINADLVDVLVDILSSSLSNDELQNELFELLGYDKFQAIEEILENRKLILKNVDLEKKKEILKEKVMKQQQIPALAPNFLLPVIVQSEKEKELMKQVRKDEKKLKNLKTCDQDENDDEITVAKLRLSQTQNFLKLSQKQPILTEKSTIKYPISFPQSQIRYPNVYDSNLDTKTHVGFISGAKLMLPENTERKDTKMYEEVKIPASPPPNLSVGNERIQISSLDEIGQIAFKGTKELNRIQTIVYPTAYHTNENLLICAPTGAGKTNVAMLTILNTIRAHADQGVIHRDQFKIVYVAPMKALAAEMTANFGKKLAPLGLSVRELTGDMQLTKTEMQATQMLVTTPEKWDVVSRKGAGDVSMIKLVKLLIIDEVHLLHGERGPVVEALVARTLRLVETQQSMIRIVGLSATLPNYVDVARFLRVNFMKGLFFFDSRFRPIPLSQQFIGVKAIKTMQALSDMDTICYEKCVEKLREGHQGKIQ